MNNEKGQIMTEVVNCSQLITKRPSFPLKIQGIHCHQINLSIYIYATQQTAQQLGTTIQGIISYSRVCVVAVLEFPPGHSSYRKNRIQSHVDVQARVQQ